MEHRPSDQYGSQYTDPSSGAQLSGQQQDLNPNNQEQQQSGQQRQSLDQGIRGQDSSNIGSMDTNVRDSQSINQH